MKSLGIFDKCYGWTLKCCGSFCHQIYLSHIKLNQLSFSVEKKNNFVQVSHKSRTVCIIKMARQKIVCCGFGFDTARTQRI